MAFGLENVLTPPVEIDPAVDAALALVGLGAFRRRRPDTLSGGEQQRVAIAAGLALGPRILVLDEPSANLDPRATADLFGVLEGFARRRSHTLIVVEHKLDELLHWIDSLLVLGADGRVLFRGDPRTGFYERGEALSRAGVWRPQTVELVGDLRGSGWPVPGSSAHRRRDGRRAEGHPRSGSGHRRCRWAVERPRPRRRLPRRGPLAARSRTIARGGPPVVRVSRWPPRAGRRDCGHPAGELPRHRGANGAGKSTLARLLSGVLRPPEGSVFLRGADLRRVPDPQLTGTVGYVFQNPEHQFVADTVAGELVFSLRGGSRGVGPSGEARSGPVESWLRRFGLDHLAGANPFTLSQGQKRRLSVAAMLIRGQEAIILDEPTFGQDEAQTESLLSLLEELHAEGRTVVVVTHDMRVVAEHARSLLVLAEGRVAYEGVPAAFFADLAAVAAAGLHAPPLARLADALQPARGVVDRRWPALAHAR